MRKTIKMSDLYLVYKYTSPSGKSYIGQTKNLKNRVRGHKNDHFCSAFCRTIQKYGWSNFICEILERDLTLKAANKKEIFHIKEHGTLAPGGYNLTTGGNNFKRAKETKRRLSELNKGKPKSEETKRKISKANKGKTKGIPKTEKHKRKISQALKGRKVDPEQVNRVNKNPDKIRKTAEKHRGMKRSVEAKQNMSRARKRYIEINGGAPNRGHKVYYNPNDITQIMQCDTLKVPEGWVHGNPRAKGKLPHINTETNKIKWFRKDQPIPMGWISWNAKTNGKKKKELL